MCYILIINKVKFLSFKSQLRLLEVWWEVAMENKAHFGSLTARMQAYREAVLDKKPYIDAQRALLATESYKANVNQPAVMKRALMLKNILEIGRAHV